MLKKKKKKYPESTFDRQIYILPLFYILLFLMFLIPLTFAGDAIRWRHKLHPHKCVILVSGGVGVTSHALFSAGAEIVDQVTTRDPDPIQQPFQNRHLLCRRHYGKQGIASFLFIRKSMGKGKKSNQTNLHTSVSGATRCAQYRCFLDQLGLL